MGLGAFKPGCNCGCDEVCISLRSYKFLCCNQKTYIYVSSPCAIDEIRINGEVVANPGTTTYGGLPSSPPSLTIDGTPVTGEILEEQQCGNCPAVGDTESATPTAITVDAVNCTYNVEVDTCGTTYSCSLTYCLLGQLSFFDMNYPGLTAHYECSDNGPIPDEDPIDTDHEYDITISPFVFDDLGINFCNANEDYQQYTSASSFTMTTVETTSNSVLRTLTYTVEYTGTISLYFGPYAQCDITFSDGDDFTEDGPFLMFTGDITTTSEGPSIPGGIQTDTVSVTNYVLGVVVFGGCAANQFIGVNMTVGCGGLTYGINPADGDLECVCVPLTISFGNYAWCGTGAAPAASTLFFLGPDDGGSGAMSLLFGEGA